jgi:hypothetical protein
MLGYAGCVDLFASAAGQRFQWICRRRLLALQSSRVAAEARDMGLSSTIERDI